MIEKKQYVVGDWIVHTHHGVGQIQAVDLKEISGTATRYYRIATSDSTIWFPVEQLDPDFVRPLASREQIEQAIAVLQKPAQTMANNYKSRQKRIENVRLRNTPKAFARIVRDLRERRRKRGILNKTDRHAFRSFKQRLAEEWAIVMGKNKDQVTMRMNELLKLQEVA